jgi:hypothetical protein
MPRIISIDSMFGRKAKISVEFPTCGSVIPVLMAKPLDSRTQSERNAGDAPTSGFLGASTKAGVTARGLVARFVNALT